MNQKALTLIVVVFCLFNATCNTKPSDELAKESFVQLVSKESNGHIQSYGFHKTNGVASEVMGQKMYTYEYSDQLRFNSSCYMEDEVAISIPVTNFNCREKPSGSAMHSTKFFKGALANISGDLSFIKKENGWELLQNQIKSWEVFNNYSPLVGHWILSESKVGHYFVVKSISVNEKEFIITNENDDRVIYSYSNRDKFSGIYDFSCCDEPGGTNVNHFSVRHSEDGKQLIFTVSGAGNAIFIRQ